MKILIITQKYGESEVGGRRWFLFSKELTSIGVNAQVECFINLTAELDNINSFCNKWYHFLWSDNGRFLSRLLSKFIRSVFPNLKHRLLRNWMRQIASSNFIDFDSIIISVPSFELIELARLEVFENYRGVFVLDCRDPLYLSEIKTILPKSAVVLNVSERITLKTQEKYGVRTVNTFDTLHNCMKPRQSYGDISGSENSDRYLIFFGTLYPEIQEMFFQVFEYLITDYNNRNPLSKLKLKLYVSLDNTYFQSKGIHVDSEIFELLDYADSKDLERHIQMAIAGVVPLWPNRYEGYGTKFLDYLKLEKKFIVIQEDIWKSEFYHKFADLKGIVFSDWSQKTLRLKLEELIDAKWNSNQELHDEFSLESNTRKLLKIIESARMN